MVRFKLQSDRHNNQRFDSVILAGKFDILCGAMNVTVPDVVPGNDYRVVCE